MRSPPTELKSFSGLDRARPELVLARTPDDVAVALERARREGRRAVPRGAGLSFGPHALGDDLALSTEALDAIDVDAASGRFTVGPGARWGAVLERLRAHDWIVPATVTTSAATVGGTLASNALSRFSPVHGKEGKSIRELTVLTPGGEMVRASREHDADLFHAAIGGWGGVGVVISATYQATRLPPRACVASTVRRHASFEVLAEALRPAASGERTVYAIVAVQRDRIRALEITSEWVEGRTLRTMLPHQPASPVRVPIEWGVNRWHAISAAFWDFTYLVYMRGADRTPFVDDLAGYTFFMDGHLRAKRAADRFGVPFRSMQQTFVVPRAADLAPFLRHACARIHGEGLDIALLDLLWLPRDEPFHLSSSRAGSGYACTFSFEGPFDTPRAARVLGALADDVESLGGRTHLVKNVFASAENLARTYRDGLDAYAAVKRRVDPDGVLESVFLRRSFPELFEPNRATGR